MKKKCISYNYAKLTYSSSLVDCVRFCTYTIMSSVNPYTYLELRDNTILISQWGKYRVLLLHYHELKTSNDKDLNLWGCLSCCWTVLIVRNLVYALGWADFSFSVTAIQKLEDNYKCLPRRLSSGEAVVSVSSPDETWGWPPNVLWRTQNWGKNHTTWSDQSCL